MFKINSKSLTQQRAVLKPMKNIAVFDETEEENENLIEDDDDMYSEEDGGSSCHSSVVTRHAARNETMLLAQFLSTTGPEEYATNKQDNTKKQPQFKRASRLLSRLRKRPSITALRTDQSPPAVSKNNYIPLPVYESSPPTTAYHYNRTPSAPTTNTTLPPPITSRKSAGTSTTTTAVLRDSGIYSETGSEKDSLPPLTPFLNELQQFPHPPYIKNHHHHHPRPAPLPPTMAPAAIATAFPSTSSTVCSSIRSVPEAALQRRSVRLRHVQVQTTENTKETTTAIQSSDKIACPHCRQVIQKEELSPNNRLRRPSCPPSLSSGARNTVPEKEEENSSTDAKALLAMIMKLKSQLAEEKQCRLKLEKAMYQRKQSDDRRELLEKEKDKWAGDCLWLQNRMALLPE